MAQQQEQRSRALPVLLKLFVPILLLSGAYLYFVTGFLLNATDPTCIKEEGSVEFFQSAVVCKAMSLNEIGDYYAGLLAVLSTFWLVIAFAWQAMELRFQRDEFLKTNQLSEQRNKDEDIWHRVEFIEMKKGEMAELCSEIRVLLEGYGLGVPEEGSDFEKQLNFLKALPSANMLSDHLQVSVPLETSESYAPLRIRALAVSKAVSLASKESIVSKTVGLS